MIALLYSILILAGFIGVITSYRKSKRLQRLSHIDLTTNNNTLSEKLNGYTYGIALNNLWKDFYRHIKGETRAVTLQHISIFFAALVAGVVINENYIKAPVEFLLPVLAVITLYTLYLRSKKAARVNFETGFAEALNIINGAVGAGHSLLHAIAQCGDKVDGTVGTEFKIITQRLEIGEDIERVFMDSYERLFYREYFFFIIAVLISMKGGGEVKEVINRLGKIISNAKVMDRRKYAKTAEPRASIKILIMIPVGFFFILKVLSPENFDILINDPTGRMILYYCIASELFGLFCVWTMMNKI